jgi:GMP reductase
MIDLKRELHYDEVYLIPQKSTLTSRSQADLTMTLGNNKFDLPIVPANMKSVVSEGTCEYLIRKNIFYVMHRICTNEQIADFVRDFNKKELIVSISIGIKDKDIEMLKKLRLENQRIDYITIDIAHAHNDLTLEMVANVRKYYPNSYLIVGNIATGEAVKFFEDAMKKEPRIHHINMLRAGIACGFACSTKNTTGFNRRMISTLLECDEASDKIEIMADGGISENGDYIKALNCGKNIKCVMAGSMFAGFEESAGDILVINDNKVKEYYGNASEKAKGNKIHVEGITRLIPYKGEMKFYIDEVKMALTSSVSYAGKSKVCDVYDVPMVKFK